MTSPADAIAAARAQQAQQAPAPTIASGANPLVKQGALVTPFMPEAHNLSPEEIANIQAQAGRIGHEPEPSSFEAVFYTRLPNSTFIVQKCDDAGNLLVGQTETLIFAGNRLTITNRHYAKQIAEVADMPSSFIYTKNPVSMSNENAAFNEVLDTAAKAAANMKAAGERM